MKTCAARDTSHFRVRMECVALRATGKTAGRIAMKLGITRNAVIGHLWRSQHGNGRTLAANGRGV